MEQLTSSDLVLLRRLETRLQQYQTKAQAEQEIVFEHLKTTYNLQQGDTIEDDGSISRVEVAPEDEDACPLSLVNSTA